MSETNKTLVVRTQAVDGEATELLGVLPNIAVQNDEQYEEVAQLVKEVGHKFKVFDQERTVSVKPLNDEVKRVNDWFRPGLTKLKQVEEALRRLMGDYVLAKRREEARLLQLAQAAAQKALATAVDPAQEAQGLMKQSAEAAPPTVTGVSSKVFWTWTVQDATKLPVSFQKVVPNVEALNAWVAAHGDKDVPEGVEVTPDVRFTVRGR